MSGDGQTTMSLTASGDDEIDAIRWCVTILAQIQFDSRRRVLRYLVDRYTAAQEALDG